MPPTHTHSRSLSHTLAYINISILKFPCCMHQIFILFISCISLYEYATIYSSLSSLWIFGLLQEFKQMETNVLWISLYQPHTEHILSVVKCKAITQGLCLNLKMKTFSAFFFNIHNRSDENFNWHTVSPVVGEVYFPHIYIFIYAFDISYMDTMHLGPIHLWLSPPNYS